VKQSVLFKTGEYFPEENILELPEEKERIRMMRTFPIEADKDTLFIFLIRVNPLYPPKVRVQ